jgi:hypothetical protein
MEAKMDEQKQNRYNYLPAKEPAKAYQITPAQMQAMERATQPIHIPDAPASQVSTTKIDVSQIFAAIEIKEQFSPVDRGLGFAVRAVPFVMAALLVSLAGAWLVALSPMEWFSFFAGLFLVTLVILNWQEITYSSAGLALRHQKDARQALETIVASNEAVTLAKLENEDRAHAREVGLRREVVQTYLRQLEGPKP